jgi:hypothetical protein
LRDDSSHVSVRCRVEQVAGALGAEPVGQLELAGDLLRVEVGGDRGRHVHHSVRFRRLDRPADGGAVQQVGAAAAGQLNDLVPGRGKLRHQATSDNTSRSGDDYFHCTPAFLR